MEPKSEDQSEFFRQPDSQKQAAANIGLVLSRIGLAGALVGLIYVAIRIATNPPPRFGPQGEWLYAAVAVLLIAGWAAEHAAKFKRHRSAGQSEEEGFPTPHIETGPSGCSFEWNSSQQRDSESRQSNSSTWSFNSEPIPFKTFKVDEGQLAAADSAAESGLGWDAVCRQVNLEYAGWSPFEQSLYRQAIQMAVEERRRTW